MGPERRGMAGTGTSDGKVGKKGQDRNGVTLRSPWGYATRNRLDSVTDLLLIL
jgi:hypothetical protein